jgi:two-component system, NarL family, response regulator LiaR
VSELRVSVLLVDDHTVVRKGLRALLDTEPGVAVVGEAANGAEAFERYVALGPDVVLMDLVMPGVDGVEGTRQILARDPGAHVLVLTSFGGDDKLFPAIRAGALGYFLKDTSPGDLVAAIRAAAEGRSVLEPRVARRLLAELAREDAPAPGKAALTPQEVNVLRLLARGLSNEAIAQALQIRPATARTHVGNILSKLELTNRTQAALYALRTGIATLEDGPEGEA